MYYHIIIGGPQGPALELRPDLGGDSLVSHSLV